MAIKVSTGLRNYMLGTGSLKAGLDLGKIRVFSGAVPADADAAETGTLLCEITVNSTGTGLTMDAPASGVISKNADIWSGVNVDTATATYYRFVQAAGTTGASTTERRVQGTVATVGGDMNFSSVNLTSGATQTVDYFTITLPTL